MDPPFECDYCGVEFGEYVELREHKTLHSNRVHFQCLKCEYIGKTTKLLKQHMRKHVINYFSWDFQMIEIDQINSISIQMKLNRCDECDKGFMTAAALQKHVENHDNDLRDQISDTVSDECHAINLISNFIILSFRRMKNQPFIAQNVPSNLPTMMI